MTTVQYINTIHIMSGVPGSGKSTYVKANAAEHDIILCRDEWRDELREKFNTTEYFPVPAKEEFRLWARFVNDAIMNGTHFADIWIDQTSCSLGSLVKILKVIDSALKRLPRTRNYDILVHIMETPYGLCLGRNAERDPAKVVPQLIIDRMWADHKFDYNTVRDCVPDLCIDFDHIGASGNVVKVLED